MQGRIRDANTVAWAEKIRYNYVTSELLLQLLTKKSTIVENMEATFYRLNLYRNYRLEYT